MGRLAILSGSAAGCGTFMNMYPFEGHMTPYGGVAADLGTAFARPARKDPPKEDSEETSVLTSVATYALLAAWLAVELPLSAAGDTVTLPVTLLATATDYPAKRDAARRRRLR